MVLVVVQEAASHADPRTTMRFDRARVSLDRHATYIVSTFIAGRIPLTQTRPLRLDRTSAERPICATSAAAACRIRRQGQLLGRDGLASVLPAAARRQNGWPAGVLLGCGGGFDVVNLRDQLSRMRSAVRVSHALFRSYSSKPKPSIANSVAGEAGSNAATTFATLA